MIHFVKSWGRPFFRGRARYVLDRSFFMQIYKIMPIPKDTKKVTHKDYQTRQWPMLQPFPARTEKLERHIVLEKGFRKIQKTTCDSIYIQKVFKNLFIQNLPHGILFIPFRKSVQNSQQLFPNYLKSISYLRLFMGLRIQMKSGLE